MKRYFACLVILACGSPIPSPAAIPPAPSAEPSQEPVAAAPPLLPSMKPEPEAPVCPPPPPVPPPPVMEVRFSPRGDCTEALIAFIGNAKKVIRVQAYSFTSEPIAEALVKAKAKGVDVAVILDKSNLTARATKLPSLLDGKVPVLIDSKHAIAHDKVIIVDSLHIETGSFNFTNAAEASNAENCLIIRDHKDLAKAYGDNWNEHKAHSAAPDKKALKRTHP